MGKEGSGDDINNMKGFYNGLKEMWGPKKKDPVQQKSTEGRQTSLDEIPTMDEMARAIAGLKNGKAPGGDEIPAEVWKHGGDNLFRRLHQLITNAWEVGYVPQAWKYASIVTIYKKGDRTECEKIEEFLFFPWQARSSQGYSLTDNLPTSHRR